MEGNFTTEELVRTVTRLTQSVDLLRAELVGKEVWLQAERARDTEIREIAKDISELNRKRDLADEHRRADRRLVLTAFVAPFVVLILQLVLLSKGVSTS